MILSRAAARSAAGAGVVGVVLACALLLAGCAGGSSSTTSSSSSSTTHTSAGPVAVGHGPTSASATASTASPRTVLHTVTPWSASGSLTVASSGSAAGSCFTTSLAAPSPTTYRCFQDNTLLDPCFLSPTSTHTVACLAAPWSTAQVLTLAKAPPAPIRTGAGRLWALTLADGTRCVADTGTVPEVAGVNLSYDCGGGLFAEPLDPAAAQLVVQRGRLDATTLTRVTVTAAWRV